MDKNNDALHGSLEQLMGTSRHPFVKSLFVAAADSLENPAGSYAKKLVLDSVSNKFKVITQCMDNNYDEVLNNVI